VIIHITKHNSSTNGFADEDSEYGIYHFHSRSMRITEISPLCDYYQPPTASHNMAETISDFVLCGNLRLNKTEPFYRQLQGISRHRSNDNRILALFITAFILMQKRKAIISL